MRIVYHPKVDSDLSAIMGYYEEVATESPAFSFHFLFRIVDDSIRILVVRHHKRHPSLGIRRR